MDEAVSLDSAELLAQAELFAGLDRVQLAQLAAHVDSVALAEGAVLFHQGDASDALYMVARGRLGVFTSSDTSESETRLNVVSVGDCVGEMGVITGEPRSATLRAETPAALLRIDRQRFLDLLRHESAIGEAVTGIIRRRLRQADSARRQSDAVIVQALESALDVLPPDQQLRVLQAGLLPPLPLAALEVIFGEYAEAVARELVGLGLGGPETQPSVQRVLERRLEGEGPDARECFLREAGLRLCEAECWDTALEVLARQSDRAAFVSVLGLALRGLPPLEARQATRWIDRLDEEEAAQDAELALAAAALQEERGDTAGALRILQRALGVALAAGDGATGGRLADEIARVSSAVDLASTAPTRAFTASRVWRGILPSADVGPRRPGLRITLCLGAALACAIAAAIAGREHPQAVFVLLLGAAFGLWNSNRFPDFAVSLLLAACWILWGIAAPAEAVAGFATLDWVFVLAVLGLAVAVARSGLLFRVGLLLVRRSPQSLFWQATTLLFTGLLLSPLLPDPRGRAALTGPLALAVAQASRLRDREPAAAVLGLAAWIGSGPLMFLFLNASAVCLLAWGLLPEESRVRFDWTSWLVAALPLGLLTSLGALAALFLVFRPPPATGPSRERLNVQLAVLGPPSRRELAILNVLALTVVGWFLASALGVHVGVVAVFGLFGAVVAGSFDQRAFREIDWDYLIYYGGALSIASLSASLGVSRAAADALGGQVNLHLDLLGGGGLTPANPVLFVLVVAAISLLVRLVLEPTQAALLLSLALIPLAPVVGVSPWIVVIAILSTNSPWFLQKQTPAYLVAYAATDGRLYSHDQAKRMGFAYGAVSLAALALTIPYWRLLGLV